MPIAMSISNHARRGNSRVRWVFLLDRGETGKFMGLRPKELAALHETLTWGREPGNNPVLRFFGSMFEDFNDACRTLAAKWKHLLPTGKNRVKERMTGQDKVKVKETTLGSTMGEESTGLLLFLYFLRKASTFAQRTKAL